MRKNLLLPTLAIIAALGMISCAPLDSAAVRHNDGVPIYAPTGGYGGGYGSYGAFSSSSGAPC